MEPTLVKLEITDQPEVVVVGKLIRFNLDGGKAADNPPALWSRCFADGTFAALEALADHVHDPAYVGYTGGFDPATGDFDYICGMMMKPGILKTGEPAVPEGFVSRTLPPARVAVGWVKGHESNKGAIFANAYDLMLKGMAGKGVKPVEGWYLEVYACPRFTTPDAEGNIIVDYYFSCEPSETPEPATISSN